MNLLSIALVWFLCGKWIATVANNTSSNLVLVQWLDFLMDGQWQRCSLYRSNECEWKTTNVKIYYAKKFVCGNQMNIQFYRLWRPSPKFYLIIEIDCTEMGDKYFVWTSYDEKCFLFTPFALMTWWQRCEPSINLCDFYACSHWHCSGEPFKTTTFSSQMSNRPWIKKEHRIREESIFLLTRNIN